MSLRFLFFKRMKCHSKIERYFFLILLFVLFKATVSAQSLNKHYLSADIENAMYSDPDQALKIARYLLKTDTTGNQKARINYLISKAYTVKGDYSNALNFLYGGRKYDAELTDENRINVEIDKVALLRTLSLDQQAKKILDDLESDCKNVTDADLRTHLDAAMALEKARFQLLERRPAAGIQAIKKQQSAVDELAKKSKEFELNYAMTLGQLYLAQKNLAAAQPYFESALAMVNRKNPNDIFLKIDALYGLAHIHFLKQEYDKAISLDEEALGYAKKLNNLFLQLRVTQQRNLHYIALDDVANYKPVDSMFFSLMDNVEGLEQDAINTAYNRISEDYTLDSVEDQPRNERILYLVGGFFLIAVSVSVFFWLKAVQRKKALNDIISYIEITRNNMMVNFSVSDKKQEPRKNFILKETEEQILSKLKKFESSKRFLSKDISLAILAGQLDSNTKYLSEIINTHYNVNFNTYINKLRVNYIIEKLKTDPSFINYKISYLAENCGFSSHSSFATVFKTITGISPVKFIELIKQEKENSLLEA
jgi:AraC-like DNA-binding protein